MPKSYYFIDYTTDFLADVLEKSNGDGVIRYHIVKQIIEVHLYLLRINPLNRVLHEKQLSNIYARHAPTFQRSSRKA